MKKITFLFYITFLFSSFVFAQTWSTGQTTLSGNYSVQFDMNEGTGLVTITMIGPSTRFMGIGPGSTLGQGMGDLNNDAIIFNVQTNTIEDRNMRSGTGQPPLDNTSLNGTGTPTTLDWTTVSNTVDGTTRTVVGTRAINTGDFKDFVFPTSVTSFNVIWALGPSDGSLAYHGGNKSGTMMTVQSTLGNPEFETPTKFSIFPNPGNDVMNINIPSITNEALQLDVFDVLGKRVYSETLSDLNTKIKISKWNSGLYLVRLTSSNQDIKLTKRFVKL